VPFLEGYLLVESEVDMKLITVNGDPLWGVMIYR
jgi:hypothetical protein